jgi:hypothetical protein
MLFTRIIEELNKAKKKIEHTVTCGGANDYESYRFYIGRLQGLQDALDICHDIIKGKLDE